jgi:Amt family ammonium transporter
MTLPGLALFYGGLVRSKNVLSVLMQCISVACLASVLWLVIGYSLAFGDGNQWIGDTSKMFLSGVGRDTLSGDIPETVFFAFQMTFAVITPALIVGAYVERIKFSAVLLFSGLWLLVVYAPVTHWIWAGNGWLYQAGLLDFAGGLVVHLTAGSSALVLAAMLGPRSTFPLQVDPPHNPAMVMIGASMLWVGWFGFNAGSALAADGNAGMALVVTHISAATASLVWMIMDWSKFGKPTLIGLVTGTIAGLASITPASGSVGPIGALIIGGSAGIICYLFVNIVKNKLRIDDSLDVFAVHGIGGLLGILLVAFLVDSNIGGAGYAEGLNAISQLLIQLKGTVAVLVLSVVASIIIIYVVKFTVGLRVDESSEVEGLDISSHGETNG